MPDLTRTIVAGIAELSSSDPTLLVALDVARASGARPHLVHAYQLPNFMALRPGLEAAFPAGAEQHEHALLAELKAVVRALPGGDEAACRVVRGSAAPVLAHVAGEVGADLLIVDEARAWDADLLVVGTHARGLGARLMLGSVAEAALRDAPCNVLAVPPTPVPAAVGAGGSHAWEESPELKEWLDTSLD